MEFNVSKITAEIISFIRKYYHDNKLGGAVIGISGGKDSAVCLALMVMSIGSENVLALWLPAHSKETDKNDAILLCKKFNVELKEFPLSKYSDDYINDLKLINQVSDDCLVDVKINLKPRLRMLTLYAYAAMMTSIKKKGYLVVGTSNKSERFVGYFTKGGDSVCDIAPIADLYVDEVIKVGDYLKIPKKITHKIPDDGLSGISDEDKLGFSYKDVKKVSMELETGIKNKTIDDETREKILKKHKANFHKFSTPMYQKRKRLGIYMGSFNPPHKGHIKVINYLLNNYYVDKILVVPTLSYWDKNNLVDIKDRINMLMFYQTEKIVIDTKHYEYIYTYELVKELEKEYPQYELCVIMGADNLINLDKWKNYQKLLEYNIIVLPRDNIDITSYIKKLKGNFTIVKDFKPCNISSTTIRESLSSKYLDQVVLDYIQKKSLYK